MSEDERLQAILDILARNYPDARSGLRFATPFQLLIAAMLSAQTTDRQVNRVTERLFARYPSPASLAAASPEEVAEEIKGLGLYRAKSRNIVAACRLLCRDYDGRVPDNLRDLLRLPGVGRKTALVVLSNAFGVPALAVDTHVFRVARRLGLARGNTPRRVEEELCRLIPAPLWGQAHHWLIHHGRSYCRARAPRCQACPLAVHCPTAVADGELRLAAEPPRRQGRRRPAP